MIGRTIADLTPGERAEITRVDADTATRLVLSA